MDARPQCCIERCLTKTKTVKVKDVIYYLYPTDADWARKWENAIKKYDSTYKRKDNDIICSLHFAKSSMKPVTRQLVDHSLPVIFPQKLKTAQTTNDTEPKPATKITNATPPVKTLSSKCCVDGCSTEFDKTNPKILGFEFPSDFDKRKLWVFMINLYNNQNLDGHWNQSMRVCALHFPRDAIEQDVLKDGSKPSIFKAATEARRKEIVQQQSQLNSPSNVPPIKVQSINVPLHKQTVDNHSMTRRSAPGIIVTRRSSLPYSQMPQLIPKPATLKRTNESQLDQSTIANKVVRLSNPFPTLKPNSIWSTSRPVPALNKVPIISAVKPQHQNTPTISRRSFPTLTTNQIQLVKGTTTENGTTKVILKQGTSHITRLPPQLKPAPRTFTLGNASISQPTAFIINKNLPIITKVQKSTANAKPVSTVVVTKPQENVATASTSSQIDEKKSDIILIDDEDAEVASALKLTQQRATEGASKSNEPSTSTSAKANGPQRYYLKDAEAFDYPRKLLQQINLKRQQNEKLSVSMNFWKKRAIKMNKEYRLKQATVSNETIEIT